MTHPLTDKILSENSLRATHNVILNLSVEEYGMKKSIGRSLVILALCFMSFECSGWWEFQNEACFYVRNTTEQDLILYAENIDIRSGATSCMIDLKPGQKTYITGSSRHIDDGFPLFEDIALMRSVRLLDTERNVLIEWKADTSGTASRSFFNEDCWQKSVKIEKAPYRESVQWVFDVLPEDIRPDDGEK